jgi:hypothetical protein
MLFAHHTHGFLEIEIMGRPFPDGPTEHLLAFGVSIAAAVLMVYGLFALVRDTARRVRGRACSQAR